MSGTTYVRNADGKMTLKIEGAAKEGYRCVCIVGVRDRYMIANLDSALQKVTDFVKATAGSPGEAGYRLRFRVYGKNAVMGDLEYLPCTAHEVGILIDVLADDQKLANTICALARSNILHVSFPERRSTGGNVAMVFSPHDVPMGPVYRFSAYHIVEDLSTADFEKLFPVEVLEARS